MNELERVEEWLSTGRLVHPMHHPTTVHLAKATASICGLNVPTDPPAARIKQLIGENENLILVLADGFGTNLLDNLPTASPLKTHCVERMSAIFPPSTAPALNSLHTGLWPATHGVVEWWQYLKELDLSVYPLLFRERFSRKDLREFGVESEFLFPHPVQVTSFKRDSISLQPIGSADSVYTRYYTGGRPVYGYQSLEEAVDFIAQRVRGAVEATYTFLYYSGIDRAEHDFGPNSPETRSALHGFDDEMGRLANEVSGIARIVISTDHGQFGIDSSLNLFIDEDDQLLEHLLCPPTGGGPDPIFHVRPGHADQFRIAFRRRFDDQYALLTPHEIEQLHLLGPGQLSDTARSRLGDYLGLSADPIVLRFRPEKSVVLMKGDHGGLSREEMEIPLIVI